MRKETEICVVDTSSERRRADWGALAFAFVAGGLCGWVYEVVLHYIERGSIEWGHGGVGIPFLMIYAVGAVLFELVFAPQRDEDKSPAMLFFGMVFVAGCVEYTVGWTMLHGLGVQTWDYRVPGWDWLCTSDGLVCGRGLLVFGMLGLVQLYGLDRVRLYIEGKAPRVRGLWYAVAAAVLVWHVVVVATGNLQFM